MITYIPTSKQIEGLLDVFITLIGLLSDQLNNFDDPLSIAEIISDLTSDYQILKYYECSGNPDTYKIIWHFLSGKYNFFPWDEKEDIWMNCKLITCNSLSLDL